ncbi:MAG: RNA methyltransferase substrate-binding domain-containing protein, partial [Bacillota bacterium]|nr:RNA methyltransferase substrate-binding domain-containing protein [Bacillota bacterium]
MADGWRSRPGDRQAVVPGRRPVEEALEARRVLKILYAAPQAGKGLGPLLQKARGIGVPVEGVEEERLERLSRGARHQGIVALVEPY